MASSHPYLSTLWTGIGLGIAEQLRKSGAALVVTGFGDLAEIEGTCRRLADLVPGDDRVHYVPADLSKVDVVPAFFSYRMR